MIKEKNYYSILGVKSNASLSEIKHAYRLATVKYHPDVNKNGAEIFMEIKEAYETLSNKELRKIYDLKNGFTQTQKTNNQYYSADTKNSTEQTQGNKTKSKEAQSEINKNKTEENTKKQTKSEYTPKEKFNENNSKSYNNENKNFKKNYSDFSNKINLNTRIKVNKRYIGYFIKKIIRTSYIFPRTINFLLRIVTILKEIAKDGTFKTSKYFNKEASSSIDGKDIEMPIEISYKEALFGTTRRINILHTEVCPICKGNVFVNGQSCKYCNSTGEVSIHKKLSVKIPANCKDGAKIRLKNEGTKGANGGKNGNLYLIVKIQNDSYFSFNGNDVYSTVEITPFEAVLGIEKQIKTLDGTASIKIPPQTSSGQKLRLSGQGLFNGKKKIKGDQIVTVKIVINKNMTEKEIELYKKLKEFSE